MITNLYFKNKLSYVWDADFLAFWARTTGTPDSWKNAYNLAFIELKNSGLFYKSDVILYTIFRYPSATKASSKALIIAITLCAQ